MAAPGITMSGEKIGSAFRALRVCTLESSREAKSSCWICCCCTCSGVSGGGGGGRVGEAAGGGSGVWGGPDARPWTSGAAERWRMSEAAAGKIGSGPDTKDAVGLRSAGRWLNTSTNTPRSAAKEVLVPLLVARTDEPPAEAPAATARADEPPDESPATTEGLEASVDRDEDRKRPRRGAGVAGEGNA